MPGQVIEGAAPTLRRLEVRPRLARWLRISTFLALCMVLLFGPLAFGIVQDWSLGLFEFGCAFTLLVWMAWQLAAGKIRLRWNPLFAPMFVFLGVVLTQIALHRTAYLYDSLSELWLYFAYAILAFIATQIFRADDGLLLAFGKVLAVFGSVYALFAILQGFTSTNKIYWLIEPPAGSVYGTYVNHNHYAGLIELLLPFTLVLGFSGWVRGSKRILLGFAATLMAASVFLCQSRGGMLAVIAETVFLAIVWMRQFSPKKSAVIFVTFCMITALILVWIAPRQVGSRITDVHDPARWLIHRDAIRMFAAHPFLGSGFGTFATVFPGYRVFYDGFFVNHAHDDYLELLLETGLAGFAVAGWFLVLLYREGLHNLNPANYSKTALMRAAALASCTGVLVHSFTDFNLHIPANAALFYVLCAVATANASATGRSRSEKNFSYRTFNSKKDF
jgi:O-antigen ligase